MYWATRKLSELERKTRMLVDGSLSLVVVRCPPSPQPRRNHCIRVTIHRIQQPQNVVVIEKIIAAQIQKDVTERFADEKGVEKLARPFRRKECGDRTLRANH